MSFFDVSNKALFFGYAICVIVVAAVKKKNIYEMLPGVLSGAYIITIVYRLFFPMPFLENKSVASTYSFLRARNYFVPFSFARKFPKTILSTVLLGLPIGGYLGYRMRKKKDSLCVLLLISGCLSCGFFFLCLLMNYLARINYISLSTDIVLASLIGLLLGESIYLGLRKVWRKWHKDESDT